MNVPLYPTILIVDDDTTTGWMLSTVLERLAPGHPIHCCAHGLEALAFLVTHPVCVVITDYSMPLMDGLTLTEVMTTKWPEIPVIIITGVTTATVEKQAQQQTTNFVTILEKPLSIDDLRVALLPLLSAYDSSATA